MTCLFCQIIKKEIPAEIIYEDEKSIAILDINPRSLGHLMVLPKTHWENILELKDEEVEPLFQTVKKMTELLNKKLAPAGFTIGINHGKVSGQTIDHLHIHIIPRYLNDGGGSIHSVVNYPQETDIKKVKEKILN